MKIDKQLLSEALGRRIDAEIGCAALGLVESDLPGTLTFLDDPRFFGALEANPHIVAVITTPDLAGRVRAAGKAVLSSEDPRYEFYSLYNYFCLRTYVRTPTRIDPSAVVHPRAYVAEYNVSIGAGCLIEPMACVMPDVELGHDCIVRSGATVGTEGYEKKWTRKGVLSVRHTGCVRVGNAVEIGANACIAKGMRFLGDTRIGSGTKINALAFIGHCVSIGRDCLIHLGASASGGSVVEDRVWIGPKATVSNRLRVGAGARISLGAVVTTDVPTGGHVTGNFAIEHSLFIRNLKRMREVQ